MEFYQLATGARFTFYGKHYTKEAMGVAADAQNLGCVFRSGTDVEPVGEPLLLPPEEAAKWRPGEKTRLTRSPLYLGIVVLEHGAEPRPGQIVAALVDGKSTLKTFLVRGNRPFLKAEDPRYPELIPAEELVIQGVARTIIRKAG
jgi:Peptidase S24-like